MNKAQRRAATLAALAIITGAFIGATELHRHAIATAWPLITTFIETFITY